MNHYDIEERQKELAELKAELKAERDTLQARDTLQRALKAEGLDESWMNLVKVNRAEDVPGIVAELKAKGATPGSGNFAGIGKRLGRIEREREEYSRSVNYFGDDDE